jgi:hypothetical protein
VREHIRENWATWVEEKPLWFTDMWISLVDDDLLPQHVLRERRSTGRYNKDNFYMPFASLESVRVSSVRARESATRATLRLLESERVAGMKAGEGVVRSATGPLPPLGHGSSKGLLPAGLLGPDKRIQPVGGGPGVKFG